MRVIPFMLLALLLSSCDLEPTTTNAAVDPSTLGPISSREQALILAANGAMQQGNLAAAERDYMSAIAASSGHIDAHLALARLYAKQEQPAKEQAILERALVLQPANPAANYHLGKLYLAAYKYEAALAAFDKGLTARPNDLDLSVGKGVANDMLGQHGAAQLTYARAMRVNPNADVSSLITNYAMSYLLSGEPKKAVALLEKEGKKPNAPSVMRHNLALAYGMLGRNTEAKKALRGEIDEETRTLAVARLKEYLNGRGKPGDVAPKKATSGTTKPTPKPAVPPLEVKPATPVAVPVAPAKPIVATPVKP